MTSQDLKMARDFGKSGACQVKICGLTRIEEAVGCAELGADAIGLVFYPKSPRHVTDEQARSITAALPPGIAKVGVFVNEGFDTIMQKVRDCKVTAAQLHGRETPELVLRLVREGVSVYKALFPNASPGLSEVKEYAATGYLVECAGGPLPGGNAMAWDWGMARELASDHPTIVAGGLSPENVAEAIRQASPDGVDVSSGVERAPGAKDLGKVRRFLEAVRGVAIERDCRPVFGLGR